LKTNRIEIQINLRKSPGSIETWLDKVPVNHNIDLLSLSINNAPPLRLLEKFITGPNKNGISNLVNAPTLSAFTDAQPALLALESKQLGINSSIKLLLNFALKDIQITLLLAQGSPEPLTIGSPSMGVQSLGLTDEPAADRQPPVDPSGGSSTVEVDYARTSEPTVTKPQPSPPISIPPAEVAKPSDPTTFAPVPPDERWRRESQPPAPQPPLPAPEPSGPYKAVISPGGAMDKELTKYFNDFLEQTRSDLKDQLANLNTRVEQLNAIAGQLNPDQLMAQIRERLETAGRAFKEALESALNPDNIATTVAGVCQAEVQNQFVAFQREWTTQLDLLEARLNTLESSLVRASDDMAQARDGTVALANELSQIQSELQKRSAVRIGLDALLNGLYHDVLTRAKHLRISGAPSPEADPALAEPRAQFEQMKASASAALRQFAAIAELPDIALAAQDLLARLAAVPAPGAPPQHNLPGPSGLPPWDAFVASRLELALQTGEFSIQTTLLDYLKEIDREVSSCFGPEGGAPAAIITPEQSDQAMGVFFGAYAMPFLDAIEASSARLSQLARAETQTAIDAFLDALGISQITATPGAPTDLETQQVIDRYHSDEPVDTVARIGKTGYRKGADVLRQLEVVVSLGAPPIPTPEPEPDRQQTDTRPVFVNAEPAVGWEFPTAASNPTYPPPPEPAIPGTTGTTAPQSAPYPDDEDDSSSAWLPPS